MVRIVRKVEPGEIAALLREAIRLLELGENATAEEREVYRVWKVDVLERIAAHTGDGDRQGVQVAVLASREAQSLREDSASVWGEV